MYVLPIGMILQGSAAYVGTSKNIFYFKLLKLFD